MVAIARTENMVLHLGQGADLQNRATRKSRAAIIELLFVLTLATVSPRSCLLIDGISRGKECHACAF